jgi:hypothetical protein
LLPKPERNYRGKSESLTSAVRGQIVARANSSTARGLSEPNHSKRATTLGQSTLEPEPAHPKWHSIPVAVAVGYILRDTGSWELTADAWWDTLYHTAQEWTVEEMDRDMPRAEQPAQDLLYSECYKSRLERLMEPETGYKEPGTDMDMAQVVWHRPILGLGTAELGAAAMDTHDRSRVGDKLADDSAMEEELDQGRVWGHIRVPDGDLLDTQWTGTLGEGTVEIYRHPNSAARLLWSPSSSLLALPARNN